MQKIQNKKKVKTIVDDFDHDENYKNNSNDIIYRDDRFKNIKQFDVFV